MNDELYKENILDHYHNPRNKHVLGRFDMKGRGRNASCGDIVTLFIALGEDGMVVDVGFDGNGCVISQAATSMFTESIKGMNYNELKVVTPGDIYDMLGIKISYGRSKCALLPYEALIAAIKEYEQQSITNT